MSVDLTPDDVLALKNANGTAQQTSQYTVQQIMLVSSISMHVAVLLVNRNVLTIHALLPVISVLHQLLQNSRPMSINQSLNVAPSIP